MKSSILPNLFSDNIQTMGIMYEVGLSVHKNGFMITFANLSFVLVVVVLFALTTAIV